MRVDADTADARRDDLIADPRLGTVPEFTRRVLFERLARPQAYLRTFEDDLWHRDRIPEGMRSRGAAVLIPLVPRPEGVQVLLTQRTSHLNAHAGQISFPGGGVEPADRDRVETALRETEEEVGIARDQVEVLGAMPEYELSSGFRVTPVVGWIEPPYTVAPDPFEVQDVFEIPLTHFLVAENFQRRSYEHEGLVRRYLAAPYQGRYVWGATAGMLYFFFQLLRG
jgi:8-oxo-dGTP pyrophosphatase MutT (NUDIX family)